MTIKQDNPENKADDCVITKDMSIGEIVALFPPAGDILAAYGMHCSSCSIGSMESLEEGCQIHGFAEEVLYEMMDDINTALREAPKKNQVLILTKSASKALRAIADSEKIEKAFLNVIITSGGEYCLEFAKEKHEHEMCFSNTQSPDVSVCASELILQRIGGAVIDYRNDKFALDLPEEKCCSGKEAGECKCG